MDVSATFQSWGEYFGLVESKPEPQTYLEQAKASYDEFNKEYIAPLMEEGAKQYEQLSKSAQTFYAETVEPNASWAYTTLETFLTETVPTNFNYYAGVAQEKFGQYNEEYFTPAYEASYEFATETAPEYFWNAVEEVKDLDAEKVKTFFSETIPAYANSGWEKVKNIDSEQVKAFFTETIPGWADQGHELMNEYPETTRVALLGTGLLLGYYLANRNRRKEEV